MKKYILISVVLILFFSCIDEKKIDSPVDFYFRDFKFGTTKEEILKNEDAQYITESNIIGLQFLSYKVNIFDLPSTLEYYFLEDKFIRAAYGFDFHDKKFLDVIKNYERITEILEKEFGLPHFVGFKTHDKQGARILNKSIKDPNIIDDIKKGTTIYLVEWKFDEQVIIQLVIRGQPRRGLYYYLTYVSPEYYKL